MESQLRGVPLSLSMDRASHNFLVAVPPCRSLRRWEAGDLASLPVLAGLEGFSTNVNFGLVCCGEPGPAERLLEGLWPHQPGFESALDHTECGFSELVGVSFISHMLWAIISFSLCLSTKQVCFILTLLVLLLLLLFLAPGGEPQTIQLSRTWRPSTRQAFPQAPPACVVPMIRDNYPRFPL